jgi:prepilin-type N-terminal cleavage/methylation domain-containing protein
MGFAVETYSDGRDLVVKITGNVDEYADFKKIPRPPNQRLVLDLAGVTMLNSVGLRTWVNWTRELRLPEGIFLRNCPPPVVHQMNILDGFLPLGATVESFQIPYHCESCGHEENKTLERNKDFREATIGEKEKIVFSESIPCSACSEAAEADIMPAKYLKFLRRDSGSRGFSLIEMMISVAIVSSVFFLSFDQVIALNTLYKKVDAQVQSRMDASLVSEYLTRQVRQVGGGFVRPWMALVVENGCGARDGMPDCGGADRLSYAHLNRDRDNCRIISAQIPNRFNFDIAMTHCCDASIESKQIIVSTGGAFGSFYVNDRHYDVDTNQCWVDVLPGQLYPFNAANAPTGPVGNFTDWSGADLAEVRTTTIYLDEANRALHAFTDTNNNRVIDTDEDILIADQVVDLQILRGFDRIPQDGSVENRNNDTDEWERNSTSPNDRLGAAGLSAVTLADLRMIAIGVITEGRHYGQTNELEMFDGPTRTVPNAQLTTGQSRIYLRSTFIYNN